MSKGNQNAIGKKILPRQKAKRNKCSWVAFECLKQNHESVCVIGVSLILKLSPHAQHCLLVDDYYAKIMNDLESETFVIDRANDLLADRSAKFIALLDQTEFF